MKIQFGWYSGGEKKWEWKEENVLYVLTDHQHYPDYSCKSLPTQWGYLGNQSTNAPMHCGKREEKNQSHYRKHLVGFIQSDNE